MDGEAFIVIDWEGGGGEVVIADKHRYSKAWPDPGALSR